MSKQAGRFPEGAYPTALVRGHGAIVMDADGHDYVDWICALGAITLGYNRPEVDAAVMRAVAEGPIFSLPHKLEAEVAEKLCAMIPCAEMARFVKTGSEATEAALRVARAATGRSIVLQCGYHAWHTWYAATRPERPGVPDAMTDLVRTFTYNDLRSLDLLIHAVDRDNVAAIILEPTLIDPPTAGFLEGVRQRATEIGAVLIFDEIVTGFRWHRAGYQAISGVLPDLATFGKGMGNGYPIAALVGQRALMQEWGQLVSGTFGGDCVGLAAANAVISVFSKEPIAELMHKHGEKVLEAAGQNGAGQPPHPVIRFAREHDMAIFLQETARRGVLLHPAGCNVSAALEDGDVKRTVTAIWEAKEAVARGVPLEGRAISPHPFRKVQ